MWRTIGQITAIERCRACASGVHASITVEGARQDPVVAGSPSEAGVSGEGQGLI